MKHPFTHRWGIFLALLLWPSTMRLQAYPEFREFIVKQSQKPVNCAFCHQHSDGPEGMAAGQIGALNAEQLQRLARARSAFDPGQAVDSPVLNPFGNSIIQRVGKKKFLELRLHPSELAPLLDPVSDLDQDGIPDVKEYLEGTHPVNPNDGNPRMLFWVNLKRNLLPLAMTLSATVAGLFGLFHLLRGFDRAARLSITEEKTTE
jgi:hypothetical protein